MQLVGNSFQNPIVKLLLLSLLNVLVLLHFAKEHTFIVLAIISCLVYFVGILINGGKRRKLDVLLLLFISLLFVFRNYDVVFNLFENTLLYQLRSPIFSVQKLGLSYIFFRYLFWLHQCRKGLITESNFISFINYIIFFPTVLAGPIDDYKNFHYWLKKTNTKLKLGLAYAVVTRLLLGSFKTLIIVPFVISKATNVELLLQTHSPLMAIFLNTLYYSAYIYVDFSGYSDLAIGTSYLLGFKIPENFDNPYFSTNLAEFWRKWHKVDSTILVCPYNGALLKKIMPDQLLLHQKWQGSILTLCKEKDVAWIDASDLSFITGTFEDHQHFNGYGAYLLYEKIKTHYGIEK